MREFYKNSTEYAKTNGSIRLSLNYATFEVAKQKEGKEVFWIQDIDVASEEPESVVLSLGQAKWLIEELQSLIVLLEDNEEESFEDFLNEPQEVSNDLDFDDYDNQEEK